MSNLNIDGLLDVIGRILQNGEEVITEIPCPNGTTKTSGYTAGTQGGVNFSNGFKIRWGRTASITTSESGTTTTFIDPFEVGATAVATLQARTGFAIQQITTTQIRFRADSSGYTALWIAVGY